MTHKPTLKPNPKLPATIVSFDWLVRLPTPNPTFPHAQGKESNLPQPPKGSRHAQR